MEQAPLTKVNTAQEEMININEIKKLIPHRYPMLMIDRIERMHDAESAVGIKNVTINEPFFEGHFPENPVMPGVLIVEAMAQTAGVIVSKFLGASESAKLVYFMSIDEARFRKPVVPGNTLELHVKKLQNRRTVWKFEGQAIVNGTVHAEAVFTAMIAESSEG
jgi:3-hydroxyacyl-[acyl-carrier-protein] dehydratase